MPRSSGQIGDAEPRDRRTAGRSSPALEADRARALADRMPMIALSVVVLPAPLRPSSVTTSPSRTSKVDAVQHVALAVPGVRGRAPSAARATAGGAAWRARAQHGRSPYRPRSRAGPSRPVGVVALGQHLAAREHGDGSDRSATTERLCSTISTVRLAATRGSARDALDVLVRHAGHRLVEQQHLGSSASVVAISSARLRP
jgi:hypothetical protein